MSNVTNVEQYVLDKRKEFDEIETKWNKLSKEFKDKVTKLVASGMKPSISRGNSSGRQLSVNLTFETNTDAAKKYVEETRVILQEMIEKIKTNTEEAGKMAVEGNYNNKEKLALIKLFLEYMHFIETAEFDAGKSKITFDITEETKESKKKILALEKEIKDTEEAKRLGVDVKDLQNHKKYLEAKRKYNTAKTSGAFLQAAKLFNEVKSYKDAAELADVCTTKGKELKTKEVYQQAEELIQKDTIESLTKAITELKTISDYLDSKEKIQKCTTRIQEIKDEIVRNTYQEAEAYFNERTINSLKRAIPLYEQIIDYKDSKEKIELSNKTIQELIEEEERIRKDNIYLSACTFMQDAKSEEDYNKAIDKFKEVKDYKDSSDKINECKFKIEELKNEGLYQEALFAISQGTKVSYQDAIVVLKELKNYKDSKKLCDECTQKVKVIEEQEQQARIKAEEERKEQERKQEEEKKAKEKKKKTIMRLISIVSIVIIVISIALPYYKNHLKPTLDYNKAVDLLEEKQYDEAIEIFTNLGTFQNSEEMISESKYQKAMNCFETQDYENALILFEELEYYSESSTMEARSRHALGQQYFNNQQYEKAVEVLSSVKYSSISEDLYNQSAYHLGLQQFEQGLYEEGYDTLWDLRDLEGAREMAQELYYQQALDFYDAKDFEKSNPMFKKLGSYKDSPLLIHNHNFKEEVITELTCEQNGEVKQTCECGSEEIVTTETTGHEMVEATCTEPKKCTKCDLIEAEALGHEVQNDVCTRCGANLMEPVTLKGKTTSYIEEEKTVTLPQGLYEFKIKTKLNKNDRWTVNIEGTEIFFGYGAATSNGTFTHTVETKNAGDYRISIKINGEYTLTITPKN